MKHGSKVLALVAAGLLVGPMAARAATLLINADGILTGAQGVMVDGAVFDVEFHDGSCSTFYGNCGPGGNFGDMYQPADPDKRQFAIQASYALLDQVLTGAFDSDASLTSGCSSIESSLGRCYIMTPYWWQNVIIGTASGMMYAAAVNGSVLPYDLLYPYPVFSNDDMVVSTDNLGNRHTNSLTSGGPGPSTAPWAVWAVWHEASVPEPGPLALFGIGLAGLALRRRRTPARQER